jgi:hypothetical protein
MRTTIAAAITAAVLLAACGGGGDATSNGPESTTSGSARATAAAPDTSEFCDAAAFFSADYEPDGTVDGDTGSLEAYGNRAVTAVDAMIASVPDRSLVPVLEGQKKSITLIAGLSSQPITGDGGDTAAIRDAYAEAEAAFPKADQDKVVAYVKSECGFDLDD